MFEKEVVIMSEGVTIGFFGSGIEARKNATEALLKYVRSGFIVER